MAEITKPLPLLNLYLDDGTRHLARKAVDFKGDLFSAMVIESGTVDRSIPYPSGLVETGDATVTLADPDGAIKGWFDNFTPFRRIGEIVLQDESDAVEEEGVDFPIVSPYTSSPSGPIYEPLFTGEIIDFWFPPAQAVIVLREIGSQWLGREIPGLMTRDHFPNIPDDVEYGFIPIIFGRVTSQQTHPQGVVRCMHIDYNLHRYVVARHSCYSIPAVYRNDPQDSTGLFHLVDPSEYDKVIENKTINGIVYPFTYIQFHVQQFKGALINADVYGYDERYDFATSSKITGAEVRNPVDCIMNLIYYLLLNEVRIEKFDKDSFVQTRARCAGRGYVCDLAITDKTTGGGAVSLILTDFILDFFQSVHGKFKIHLFDLEDDEEAAVPINTSLILKRSHIPRASQKVFNRFRYLYGYQNAEFAQSLKSSKRANWAYEFTIDNLLDQAELTATGANALLETEVTLRCIRGDSLASNVTKRRIGYHTLRSYPTQFTLPLPKVIRYLDLAVPIALTHPNGIADGGWTNQPLKCYGLNLDLATMVASVRAVTLASVSDADLEFSFDTHPTPDVEVLRPQLAVTVNTDGEPPTETAAPQADFNDLIPAPPLTEEITVGLIYGDVIEDFGFTSSSGGGGSGRTIRAGTEVGFINVRFQEDPAAVPRKVSAYIPDFMSMIEGMGILSLVVGTLSPDEKPTDLTEDDINKVVFYSTDFDHLYLYVGGEGTGWRAMGWDGGNIVHRIAAPFASAYALCDGSVVTTSTPFGTTESTTLPDLIGAYIKGGDYDGPGQTAAEIGDHNHVMTHGHTASGSSSGHTHTAGGYETTGDGAHTHPTVVTQIGAGGHTHTVSLGGSTGSDGAHTHSGSTIAAGALNHYHNILDMVTDDFGAFQGAHAHTGASGPPSTVNLSHSHTLSGTTGSNNSGHTHDFSGLTGADASPMSVDSVHTGSQQIGTYSGHDHSYSDTTGGESSSHDHDVSGSTDSADAVISAGAIGVTVPNTSSEHQHKVTEWTTEIAENLAIAVTIASDGSHTHTLSGSGSTDNPGDHTHSVGVSVSSDGYHGHSIVGISGSTSTSVSVTVNNFTGNTGIAVDGSIPPEPVHVTLLPYFRL